MKKPQTANTPKPNTRAIAALALAPVLQQKASLDSSIDDIFEKRTELSKQDQAFVRALCFGVCRHSFSLEAVLSKLLSKNIKSKDYDVKALLLVGIYQLWQMRVPDHAAINECVNATKKLKKLWAKNLANAVLRNFIRQKEGLIAEVENGDARFEHPDWLLQKLRHSWPNHYESLMQSANIQAPLTLRVNESKTSRADYRNTLDEIGVPSELCDFSAHGLRLENALDITSLPGFKEGMFSVQDEAAQLSVSLLQLESGQRVLDACCAPGGKTCHIAETQPDLTELVALDADAIRMKRVEENLQRLRVKATLKVANANSLEDWWEGEKFDRILLDAPCSATGVIRHHPDIKLLRRADDIPSLVKLQSQLLSSLWTCLKDGGLLLYATCSILPDENEKVIEAFVAEQANAIHLALDVPWGEQRPFGRQLFPTVNSHDGFYYSLLKKTAN